MTDTNRDRTRLGFLHPPRQLLHADTSRYRPSQLQELLARSTRETNSERQMLLQTSPATGVSISPTVTEANEPKTAFAKPGPAPHDNGTPTNFASLHIENLTPTTPAQLSGSAVEFLPQAFTPSKPATLVTRISPAQPSAVQPLPIRATSVQPSPTFSSPTKRAQSGSQVLETDDKTDKFLWLHRFDSSHIRLVCALGVLGLALAWVALDTAPARVSAVHGSPETAIMQPIAAPKRAIESIALGHATSVAVADSPKIRDERPTTAASQATPGSQPQGTAAAVTPRQAADLLFAGQQTEAQARYQALNKQNPDEEVYRVILNILKTASKHP